MCSQVTSILSAVPLCMVKDAQTKVAPKRGGFTNINWDFSSKSYVRIQDA